MASTVIYKDSIATGVYKFTFSAWVKRSKIGSNQTLLGMYNNNNYRGKIRFDHNTGDDLLYVWIKHPSAGEFNWYSNAKFRDTNGWYHIVVAIDTTQSTASNRYKIYVNGEEISGTNSGIDLTQNSTSMIFGHSKHSIGNSYYNGSWESQYFDGLMSHVHCCYGYAYQASDFGETDSTTGEWKIKTTPSVSYGSNGHFILKDGNSTTDQSGNSISLTTNGTLTKTEDNPSNVFATLNPLARRLTNNAPTYLNGNTSLQGQTVDGQYNNAIATIGDISTGKFYWEVKVGNIADGFGVGISDTPNQANGTTSGNYYVYYGADGNKDVNGSTTSYGASYTTNDIIGVAIDATSGSVTFYKNGVSQGTADTALITNMVHGYTPVGYTNKGLMNWNLGNGYFGTTAVSSAGTNASGNGIFEYDVPTGFTALSTKGLNL